jgi:hypothetical protein
MKLPTIEQLKTAAANADFFDPRLEQLYSDKSMSVHDFIYQGKKFQVLKVLSIYGTRPIYSIDPSTLKLTYLMHENEDV